MPKARQYTDPVRTFAYGTDASFYRLNPKLVLKVHSEEEIKRILPIAKKHAVPVTFRAAGTSLSGQALTDSVLIKISHTGKNFRNFTVHVSSSREEFYRGVSVVGWLVGVVAGEKREARGRPVPPLAVPLSLFLSLSLPFSASHPLKQWP